MTPQMRPDIGLGGADRRDRLGEPRPVRRLGGGRSPQRPRRLRSGMRQLLIGDGAALLVYLIGRGVGALTGVQLGA
jgi:hypothetical protein